MCILHKWKYYQDSETDSFLGEDVKRYYLRFRQCIKCGHVQEKSCPFVGDSWNGLSPQEIKVFNNKKQLFKEGKK